jgi:hypothetical protein
MAGVVALAIAAPQLSLFTKQVSQGFHGGFIQYGWIYKSAHNRDNPIIPYGLVRFTIRMIGCLQ